jgi:hypothetical protein
MTPHSSLAKSCCFSLYLPTTFFLPFLEASLSFRPSFLSYPEFSQRQGFTQEFESNSLIEETISGSSWRETEREEK